QGQKTSGRPSRRRCGLWGSTSSAAFIAGRGGWAYDAGPRRQQKSSPPTMGSECSTPFPSLMACILALAYPQLDEQLRTQQQHQ
ncbi:hypothetical protein NDU88_006564, partial [Pleurodeles waltl]